MLEVLHRLWNWVGQDKRDQVIQHRVMSASVPVLRVSFLTAIHDVCQDGLGELKREMELLTQYLHLYRFNGVGSHSVQVYNEITISADASVLCISSLRYQLVTMLKLLVSIKIHTLNAAQPCTRLRSRSILVRTHSLVGLALQPA